MATVNELVTKIRFEVEQLQKVRQAEQEGKRFAKSTKEVNKEWNASQKIFSNADKTLRRLTEGVTTLGVASGVTSGIWAAWGINAAKTAQNITNIGFATQLTARELQTMYSVYRRFGSSPETFTQDAAGYLRETRRNLTPEEFINIAEEIRTRGLSEADALAHVTSRGLSADTARILYRHGDELTQAYAEAESRGHIVSDDDLQRLERLNTALAKTTGTISGVSTSLQAALAGPLSETLSNIDSFILRAQEDYKILGEGFVGTLSAVTKSITDGSSLLDNLWNQSAVIAERRAEIERERQKNENPRVAAIRDEALRNGYPEEDANIVAQRKYAFEVAHQNYPNNRYIRDLAFSPLPSAADWKLLRQNLKFKTDDAYSAIAGYEYLLGPYTPDQIYDMKENANIPEGQELEEILATKASFPASYFGLPPGGASAPQGDTNIEFNIEMNGIADAQDAVDGFEEVVRSPSVRNGINYPNGPSGVPGNM